MSIDQFNGTIFEYDFSVIEKGNEESYLLPGPHNECRAIADAECNVLGYIREDAADIVVRILNQSWDRAEKRRPILYEMAIAALACNQDLCDQNDIVEMFEDIIANHKGEAK